jgi:hypothetical protein
MFTKHNKPNEYELGRIGHKGSFRKVSGRSVGSGNMYRIGGAAESTGSADLALELDYRGAFLGSGGGNIRSMAYDVEIMGAQNAWYSPKKTPSSHLATSH